MRKRGLSVLTALCLSLSMTGLSGCTDSGEAQVVIVQFDAHPTFSAMTQEFFTCMSERGNEVTYIDKGAAGDADHLDTIVSELASGDYDLIIPISTQVAQAVAKAVTDTPIVFAGVTDPVTAGLVSSYDSPGGNITGTSDYPDMNYLMKLVTDLNEDALSVGIVVETGC